MEELDVMEVLGRAEASPGKVKMGRKFILSRAPDSSLFQVYSGLALDILEWGGDEEPGRPGRAVVVSSPAAGDGRTLTAVNLAAAAGGLGAKVLLVDADLAAPSCASLFGLDVHEGLVETVIRKRDPGELAQPLPAAGTSLLPAGAVRGVNPFALFAGKGFSDLLSGLRESFDLVVFDSAPLDGNRYVPALFKAVRDVLGVVRAESTRRSRVSAFIEAVRAADGALAGLVFNDRRRMIPSFIQRLI